MANKYLQDLLKSQELTSGDNDQLEQHKEEVESFLRKKFGQDPIIKIAGSPSKGTAIRESYDLDIVVYFSSSDDRSLKQIYEDTEKLLSENYVIQPKTSALRITGVEGNGDNHDYHIDVVPGRFIESSKDVFLHVNYGEKERMQTNLKTHIDYITNSGCQEVIRLVKIWKKRNSVQIRTFVLELFVIKHLEGKKDKSDLESSFKTVMEAFRDNKIIGLIDPANSNNNVSNTLDTSQKQFIATKAGETLETLDNKNLTESERWQVLFKETAAKQSVHASPRLITNPPTGQWNCLQ